MHELELHICVPKRALAGEVRKQLLEAGGIQQTNVCAAGR